MNNRKLDRIISKNLKETLEEKANKIASKLKSNINELGGMSPDAQDTEHPFYNLNASKMSKKEMNDLMRKHYGKEDYLGKDDEENDWEEIDIKGMNDMEDDGLGIPDDMPSYKTKYRYSDEDDMDEEDFDYEEEQESDLDEGFDSFEMKNFRKRKDYDPKEFRDLPLGKDEIGFDEEQLDDNSGVDMRRRFFNDVKRSFKRKKKDFDGEYGDEEFAEGKGDMCECGGMMKEGECSECGYKMEGIYDVHDIDNKKNRFDYVEKEMNEGDEGVPNIPLPADVLKKIEDREKMKSMEKNPMDKMPTDDKNVEKPETDKIEEDFDFEMDDEQESEMDIVQRKCEEEGEDSEACKKHMQYANMNELQEKLHGNQRKLDKNRNGRLDAADFKMLRAMKGKKHETDEEVEEGNLFSGKRAEAIKKGEKDFEVDGKTYPVKESVKKCKVCGMKNCKCKHRKNTVKLSESQLIELIEGIIVEQKEKLKNVGGQPRGLQKYKQSHEKSGKFNKENQKNVGEKMKKYVKDGSKGGFDMNPKKFPMGNGELGETKKKAYQISKDGKEFLDRYQRPGMENLDYDEIHPNEDWMKDNIEGSSRTGNNPKWANAVETDVNKNVNKKREANEYAKAKRAAFQKSPQPVINDKTGDEDGTGIHINLGKSKKLKEEFERMKGLIGYDRSTQ